MCGRPSTVGAGTGSQLQQFSSDVIQKIKQLVTKASGGAYEVGHLWVRVYELGHLWMYEVGCLWVYEVVSMFISVAIWDGFKYYVRRSNVSCD